MTASSGIKLNTDAKIHSEEGFASVFEGLAFDKNRVRRQAIGITDQEGTMVAITNILILPKSHIQSRRYFQRETGGVTGLLCPKIIDEFNNINSVT